MKISSNYNKNSPSYKGMLNNKALLKGLETVSDHGATFVAATTLAMSTGVRPLAIALTPDTDEKTKQYAITNSIASGLIKFALVEAVAIPVENAVKKIDKTPAKYLTQQTIDSFKGTAKTLTESADYKFATQFLKQSTGFITAIPKTMLTVALIPVIMNKLFKNDDKKTNDNTYFKSPDKENSTHTDSVFNDIETKIYRQHNDVFSPSFSGGITDMTAKGIGQILNTKTVQNTAKKFSSKDNDIAKNFSMATDLLLTASFIHRTKKSDKIEENKKKPLIYNNVISTGITLAGGYSIDKLIQKNTKGFIEKFSEINKNDPKLNKYIEGINIIRPTVIFALLYYGVLPVFSTYLSDKIDKFINKTDEKTEKENSKIK